MSSQTRLLAACATLLFALPATLHAQETAAPSTAPADAAPAPTDPTPAVPEAAPAPAPTAAEIAPADVAAETAPAAEEAPMELSAAELAELGLSTAGTETAVDTSFKIYGFADFSLVANLGPKNSAWRGALARHPTFYVGNFNLYIAKNLTENLRTMGEVRFTYLPNGSTTQSAGTGEFAVTSAGDYADFNRQQRWGGIILQRIYLEWTLHELATVRLGQFLTPYGIWNVDHGSPVIIPVQRPYIIGQQLFPERQTGIELFGRRRIGSENVVGYNLTLSNGFGPISEYRDLDGNKAIGGRLYWQFDGFGQLQVGGSFFYGHDTSTNEVPGVNSSGRLAYTERIRSKSEVLSLALDVQYKYQNFIIQSEAVVQQRAFREGGRFGAQNPLLGAWIAPQDDVAWGAYVLTGYRLDWFGVMPYFLYNRFSYIDPTNFAPISVHGMNAGLNIRPVEMAVLKLEYVFGRFPDGYLISDDDIHLFQAQVAWAF